MKKIFAIIAVISILFLNACEKKPSDELAPEGGVVINNQNVDYFFYYPSEWESDRTDEGMTSVKRNTITSAQTIRYASITAMAFTLDDSEQLVKPYWEEYQQKLKDSMGYYEFIKESETELDGVKALKLEYKCGFDKEEVNSFNQIICIRLGTVYFLTYSAHPDDYEDNIGAFDMAAKNFHFK